MKTNKLSNLSASRWRKLIKYNERFMQLSSQYKRGKCALLSLNLYASKNYDWRDDFLNEDWITLLSFQPQFADKCPWWREFDTWLNWIPLLKRQSGFSKIAKEYSDGRLAMLVVFPEYEKEFSEWDDISRYDKYKLLESRPQFAQYFSDYRDFTQSNWTLLLSKRCEFLELAKEYPNGLAALVELDLRNERFVSDWNIFSSRNWAYILSTQPQFADKCVKNNAWGNFSERDWIILLSSQPQFRGFYESFYRVGIE